MRYHCYKTILPHISAIVNAYPVISEILFNPYTHDQVSEIRDELKELLKFNGKAVLGQPVGFAK